MKTLRIFLLVTFGVSVSLFTLNIIGKNIFLHLTIADQTFVAAASQGVCHLALTTEDAKMGPGAEDILGDFAMPDIGYQTLLKAGPINLFVENRLDPLTPLRFYATRGDERFDYSAGEFPWLLIPVVLMGLFLFTKPKKCEKGTPPL